MVMRRSLDPLKFCLELLMRFWPLADVKVDAWAVDVPPPMINAPGFFRFSPFIKSRLSGNGSLEVATWSAHARAYPKVIVFTTVGGNNMRFLRAERIETVALALDHNRVILRTVPVSPVRG